MKLTPYHNLAIIAIIISLTFLYSVYEKNKVIHLYTGDHKTLMVEQIPNFKFTNLESREELNSKNVYSFGNDVVVVHFWGTWCAPCLPEFPELVEYAKKLEPEKKIKILAVAVNDEDTKVKKFLTRFKDLPSNLIIAVDPKGEGMTEFGTVKVPETFIYYKGRSARRYVGPQKWINPVYEEQVKKLL